jgi:hypothetical protein
VFLLQCMFPELKVNCLLSAPFMPVEYTTLKIQNVPELLT